MDEDKFTGNTNMPTGDLSSTNTGIGRNYPAQEPVLVSESDHNSSVSHTAPLSSNDTVTSASIAVSDSDTVVNKNDWFEKSHPVYTKASGSGDIVLNNSEAKNNKKPLIILGIVALIAIVVIAVIASILSNTGKKSPGVTGAGGKFNQYANYILYGTDGTVLEGEYDEYKSYKLSQEFYSDTYNEQFWQSAEEKLGNATSEYVALEDKNQGLSDFLENYQASFHFLSAYRRTMANEPTSEQVVETVLSSGSEAAQKMVDEYYSALPNHTSGYGDEYIEKRRGQYNGIIRLVEIYKKYNCMNGIEIKEGCAIPSEEENQEIPGLQETIVQNREDATYILQKLLDSLMGDCWKISKWYAEPDNEQNVDEINSEALAQ